MQKQVTWIKNTQNNDWFDFLRLNLEAPYFINKRGIYVIWYTSPGSAKVVRLGQGNISERLKEHRLNPDITRYASYGQLKVSWIVLNENELSGVEKYLARVYSPLIGDRYPDSVTEIQVNLIGRQ